MVLQAAPQSTVSGFSVGFADAIKTKPEQQIEAAAADADTMTEKQREARQRALAAEVEECERYESELIEQAQQAGTNSRCAVTLMFARCLASARGGLKWTL